MENLKSEPINEALRISLFNHSWEKWGREEEKREKEEFIAKLIENTYHNRFGNKKEKEFFKNHPELVKNISLSISLKALGVEDCKKHSPQISTLVPMYSKSYKFMINEYTIDSTKILTELFKETELKKVVLLKLREIVTLNKEVENYFNKYYTVYHSPRNFCMGARTTKQLKNMYPEIYEIYKEIIKSEEHVPEQKIKENKLKNLRKQLGYV